LYSTLQKVTRCWSFSQPIKIRL